ncbi:hypothetical protein NMY22_g11058 [Coprinellus aureogranulatus]|nr:hypothetical protein NMY22_g11058 [Coprinellus aureogranulatus]
MDKEEFPVSEASAWSRKCLCGKRFHQVNSYSNHINSCKSYKRSVGATLEEAKIRYLARQSKKGKAKQSYQDDDLEVDHMPLVSAGPASLASGSDPLQGAFVDRTHNLDPPEEDGAPLHVPEPPRREEGIQAMDIDAPDLELGRGHRPRKAVKRFKNFAATSTIPFNIPSFGPLDEAELTATVAQPPLTSSDSATETAVSPSEVLRRTILDDRSWKTTAPNRFGLFKKYWTIETRPHDPDSYITAEDLQEEEDADDSGSSGGTSAATVNLFPFPNWSSFRLGEWYWADSQEKGRESFLSLLDILTSDDFDTKDLLEGNWNRINDILAASEFERGSQGVDWIDDGTSWLTTEVHLEVPFNGTSLRPGVHIYGIPGFRYRPLVPMITERLKDIARGDHFHIVPSELRWTPPTGGPDVRIYGELYNSPAYLEAYKEVQSLPPEPEESSLPRYIVALMFASDETMLASFGTSKLWPVYMMFGNESKYRRGKPSLKLFEEVAYFQSMPDEFQDWYLNLSGKKNVGTPLSTHLNRVACFNAQWEKVHPFDDEFVQAYRYGIVVDCFDKGDDGRHQKYGGPPMPPGVSFLSPTSQTWGVLQTWRQETVLQRKDNAERRKKITSARKIILKGHYSVNTAEVEKLLKPASLVPTVNAFSERLSPYGLDVYSLVAVDILHEVEIGVWKSLFIQLLRLLEVVDKASINVLNTRFRRMPTFGKDTIRRFRSNVSEMKQLAARDYEDILQCSIPAFEGLIPGEHGRRVESLLFVFAHWHSLAKLKIHTDDTLALLDEWTVILGAESRLFVNETCSAFETRELKREYQSRKRNEARKNAGRAAGSTASPLPPLRNDLPTGPGGSTMDPPTQPSATTASASQDLAAGKPSTRPATRKSARTQKAPRATTSKAKPSVRGRGAKARTAKPVAPSEENANAQDPSPATGAPTATAPPGPAHLVACTSSVPSMPPTATGASAAALPANKTMAQANENVSEEESRRLKTWSLCTSKFHALGDVARTSGALEPLIRTLHSWWVILKDVYGNDYLIAMHQSERFHRFPKARYRRTNKKQTPYQISRIQMRQARIKKLKKQLSPTQEEVNMHDPAIKNFLPKLKHHLVPRVVERLLLEASKNPEDYPIALPILNDLHTTGLFSASHVNGVYIHSDRLYRHSIFQVNFTTYECRRAQDTLNPSTSRRNIMCLRARNADASVDPSEERHTDNTGSGFIYGQLLGIVHVNVIYGGPGMLDHRPRRYDVLWVRWYEALEGQTADSESTLWSSKRMERVGLKPLSQPDACDFVDPADVLRAAHIIPRFSEGMKDQGDTLGRRGFSKCAKDDEDWKEYYVNPFVDRDMMMRFHRGMAVGHIYERTSPRLTQTTGSRSTAPGPAPSGAMVSEPQFPVRILGASTELGESMALPIMMDVDRSASEDGGGRSNKSRSVTNSEDSAYDRPLGSDSELDDRRQSNSEGTPDIQEPESGDEGGDAFQ